MDNEITIHKVQADSLELPETLLSRLKLAEEKLEDFDKNQFVTQAVREKLEALEHDNGKVVAWNIKPFYCDDEGLKNQV